MEQSYVYIITNENNTVLYTGVTSNLVERIYKHKNKTYDKSFTKKYNIDKLVYYAVFEDIEFAIQREKQIKNGNRDRKEKLINEMNPNWDDLYNDIIR